MKPHLCTQCHYRNSTYLGRDELTASCDHPDLQPEGRDLTVTEFQAPDWCPLGLVQPLKRGLIPLPENPTVELPKGDELKKALAEWSVRGNMKHEDKPDPRVPALVVEGTQADDLVVLDRTAEYGDPSVTKQEDFVWPDSPDPWKDDLDRVVTDPKDERYDPLVIHEKLTELQDARVILAMQKAIDQAFSIKIPSFETSTEPATPAKPNVIKELTQEVLHSEFADVANVLAAQEQALKLHEQTLKSNRYYAESRVRMIALDQNDPDFNLKVREAALQYEKDFQRMVGSEFDHARKEVYTASEPKSVSGFTERKEIPVLNQDCPACVGGECACKSVGWVPQEGPNGETHWYRSALTSKREAEIRHQGHYLPGTDVFLLLSEIDSLREELKHAYEKKLSERAPSEPCPRCGAETQSTLLTPPDEGLAVGCTRCSWPNLGEKK